MQEQSGSSGGLAQLAEQLADPVFRKDFAKDPDGTLDRNSIAPGDIPPEVMATLRGMTYEELRAVRWVRDALETAGVDSEIRVEMV